VSGEARVSGSQHEVSGDAGVIVPCSSQTRIASWLCSTIVAKTRVKLATLTPPIEDSLRGCDSESLTLGRTIHLRPAA